MQTLPSYFKTKISAMFSVFRSFMITFIKINSNRKGVAQTATIQQFCHTSNVTSPYNADKMHCKTFKMAKRTSMGVSIKMCITNKRDKQTTLDNTARV